MKKASFSRTANLITGLFMVGLGVLGAFLPVLPSTCFFICGAYFFGKSSHRLETWILNHPRFGYSVRSWRETRSISLAGKIAASLGMAFSFFVIWLSSMAIWLQILASLVLGLSAWYIWTRPTLKPLISKASFPVQ